MAISLGSPRRLPYPSHFTSILGLYATPSLCGHAEAAHETFPTFTAALSTRAVDHTPCPSLQAIPDGVKRLGAASFALGCGPCVCLAPLAGYDGVRRLLLTAPPQSFVTLTCAGPCRHVPVRVRLARWANGKPPIVGTCTRQVTAASEAARRVERWRGPGFDDADVSIAPTLKFRTVGFPQYGFKASLSDRACRPSVPVKRVPRIPGSPRRLPSPSPTSITAQPPGSASRTSRHFREPLYERPSLSTPGVLGSGRSCVVSSPPRLLRPHPSVSQARGDFTSI